MTLANLKLRRTTLPLTTGALIALGLIHLSPVLGDFSRDLITQPVDETKLITIGRSVRLERMPQTIVARCQMVSRCRTCCCSSGARRPWSLSSCNTSISSPTRLRRTFANG